MTEKETARQNVAAIVERFRNTPKHTRDAYNEDQTRHYFILPLFRALGWDTENPAEFSAEEQISRGFVDFGFYLNGVPAFYLETKRVREDISKPEHMKQAINYAYLKGVTWAVLTDFEETDIFNAEWETDHPEQARFLLLHLETYSTDQFDDLWLLSKPSMQVREIDATAERYGKKDRKQPVTTVLLKQMTEWRKSLFSEMRTRSAPLWAQDPHQVDNAVQKFIDRLIFIRTAEDRGIEKPRLQAELRQSKTGELWNNLLTMFRELDKIYNSNLFAQDQLDVMELYDPVLLKEIIEGLYKPSSFVRYDFNAITADVLGAVYEQYLGFKALDPEGKTSLAGKQQKRKAQGIYYTPQFVVRYIVQNTVGKLMQEGADPHQLRILDPACGSGSFLIEAFDVLDRWLAQHEPDVPATERRRRILTENIYGVDLDDQAVEVTRLNLLLRASLERGRLPLLTNIQCGNSLMDDPAVAGDAAFKWEERFADVMRGDTRPLWFVTFVTHNSRISERMVTFGVQTGEPLVFMSDEQIKIAELISQACRKYHVAVVALNVLPDHVHMVVAAQDEAELNECIRKIKGFSSYAFRRGTKDSGLKPTVSPSDDTVGAEVTDTETGFPVWARKFNRQPIQTADQLYAIIEYVRNNHHKHSDRWGEELITTWDSGLKPIVESLCVSPEEAAHVPGGFDVVVGNPPYVRQETLGAAFKEYAETHYETYAGTADLYVYFIEKGIKLLRDGGMYGVIVANKWMRANYGKTLRQWLKTQPIEEIIDFGDLPVFQEATTYPCIITVCKSDSGLKPTVSSSPSIRATQVRTLEFTDLAAYVSENGYPVRQDSLDDSGWSLAGGGAQTLLEKLRVKGVPLGKYIDGKIYMGVKTGLNEAFIIDATTRRHLIVSDPRSAEFIKPFLMGRDLKRYGTPEATRYLILMPNGWTQEQVSGQGADGGYRQDSGLKPTVSNTSDAWNWLRANYPAIAQHLAPFEAQASRRGDKGEFWWELRPCAYYDEFEKSKIMYSNVAQRGTFTLDESGILVDKTCYFMPSDDKYLFALLNSRLLFYYFANNAVQRRGGYFEYLTQYVEHIPIRTINFDDPSDKARHDRMVEMVEQMITLKQEHAQETTVFSDRRHELAQRIERLDRDIDALVYELYGLTDEEIAIVQGR